MWRGWPQSRWWNAPLLFWDDFSDDGQLGDEPSPHNAVASLCAQRAIPAGESAEFTFLLAWRFPNRTPEWTGWHAPKGEGQTVIGNHYSARFKTAWDAAEYAAAHLETLERETRLFAATLRDSTLPGVVKEAAGANLSTLVSNTCFRTADGEFHGFEGVHDLNGCCHGNCTHVWNYESTTAFLFPSLAHSLRKAAFGYSMDDAGAMHFRQSLPDGKDRSGFAAADGQMGQIMHAYLDWVLSGDAAQLGDLWPRVKKGIEFAWVPGGWDADRDGVLEGVQHNTYDVEFYGPNPLCGIFYLGALRAGEEMARAAGDTASATEYRRLFENGRNWTDANLFNGEYYIQKIRGVKKEQVAASLRSTMGSDDTENPQYQVGEGCLVDQLLGQYLADVAGLGPLLDRGNVQKTAASLYRYNYKRSMVDHDNVQRTFALNDESALVICDYGKTQRPKIPFPYFAEAFTGSEYSAAVLMLYHGMAREGVECIGSIRARYDGEKRNPWDEAECGHHYARAMSAWSGVLALSGFRYDGRTAAIEALPRVNAGNFRCFWSAGTGWGTFSTSTALYPTREVWFQPPGPQRQSSLPQHRISSRWVLDNGDPRGQTDRPQNLRSWWPCQNPIRRRAHHRRRRRVTNRGTRMTDKSLYRRGRRIFSEPARPRLILAAAHELAKRGLKSAVIVNDQGDSLVDTQFARQHGFDAEEVTGGCFCCQFSDLIDSAEKLRAHSPDVIFAEPVGSCMDLSATVLRPLREHYSGDFRLAPFTVCVDPVPRPRNREARTPIPICPSSFATSSPRPTSSASRSPTSTRMSPRRRRRTPATSAQ